MNRCRHPEHPHCTAWVMPGECMCAHGHVQAASQPVAGESVLLAADAPVLLDGPAAPGSGQIVGTANSLQRPHLHVSGFDPRAAGGRQLLKLELRGMPADCAPEVTMQASSRLYLDEGEHHRFTRTARGEWLPVFLAFSSRGLEHGQYRIELALHSRPDGVDAAARTWIATLPVLAPRRDASLREIHQTFLATHKNVRVSADDASIARVGARLDGGSSIDIDVSASNAGIAHLDLDASSGKIDLGFSSIAWDEVLLEVDRPAPSAGHPCPASSACLVLAAGAPGAPSVPLSVRPSVPPSVRYLRLFALDEFVLGRDDSGASEADLLLAHHEHSGPSPGGLTRRISARHAFIRRGREGYEIEDVSRYGLLVDGRWPGKHAPTLLVQGMRIELTASIPGVVVLEVAAVLAHGIVLRRIDAGAAHEAFYLVEPEHAPGAHAAASVPGLPLLFHRDGGFWHADPAGAEATPLTPTMSGTRLPAWPRGTQFTARPYPDMRSDPASPARRGLASVADAACIG